MGWRTLAAAGLLALCAWGCGSPARREADDERWRAWDQEMRDLAVEAVRAEKSFWPDEESAQRLTRAVLTTQPDIVREWALYTWWAGRCRITVDLYREVPYIDMRGLRREPGRLGARSITLATIREDSGEEKVTEEERDPPYGPARDIEFRASLYGNRKELMILVGKKVLTEWGSHGRLAARNESWGRTVLDPR